MMQTYYQDRIKSEEIQLKLLQNEYNKVSNWRLLAILIFAVTIYFLLQTSPWLFAVGIILGLTGFYYLVKYHDRLEEQRNLRKVSLEVLQNETQMLSGKENKYNQGDQFIFHKHAFTDDLDVFGSFSLFQKINRAKTKKGIQALADSLLARPNAAEILIKQAAVKELKEKDEWRQTFQASLFEVNGSASENLVGLEEPPKIRFETLIGFYSILKWMVPLVILAAFYFGSAIIGTLSLFGFLAFHFGLSALNKEFTELYFHQIKGISRDMIKYKVATDLILKENWQSERLKSAKNNLPIHAEGKNPILDFLTISKRIDMKDNQMAAFFLYLVSPFDLVELVNLRKWVKKNPSFFKEIFENIAEFEQFTSMATLAFNYTNWVFPEIEDQANVEIKGNALGHPLINPSVCNDFELNAKNRLTLITGSNMSGKSTLLRTLGCNLILAYAGMPVFASKLSVSSGIRMYTYMRIKDSLQENASTFKAEIDRIKMLLMAMFAEEKVLVLVDEMLRGTNSEDKLKGSMAFLEKVIESKAYALVATHDLRTTETADKYPDLVKNFYFEYDSKDGELSFDYKLKEGVCKSFNASELLRSVGLEV